MNISVVLQLPPIDDGSDPVAYGRWLRSVLRELTDPPEGAGGAAPEASAPPPTRAAPGPTAAPASDHEALAARWYAFAPHRRARLGRIIDGLRDLGYRLEPSVDRRTGEPGARSYAPVLRPDGANLGYLKTTSMELVGPRRDPRLDREPAVARVGAGGAPLRYPRLDITRNDAVPALLRVAQRFAQDEDAGTGSTERG